MIKVMFLHDNHSYPGAILDIVLLKNKTMTVNIGSDERVIRVFAGMVIASMCIFYNSAWALIGIPIMVSAAMGICPLYSLLGIKTTGKKSSEA